MKKIAVLVFVLTVSSLLFGSVAVKWGASAQAGTEIFSYAGKSLPQKSLGIRGEIGIKPQGEAYSFSFPVTYWYTFEAGPTGRYRVISSNKVGLGVLASYDLGAFYTALGLTGGIWTFNSANNIFPMSIFHTYELRCGYCFSKHFSVEVPVSLSRTSFGTTFNLSVSLNIH